MWVKQYNDGNTGWMVYHKGLHDGSDPAKYFIMTNSSNAEQLEENRWNDQPPTDKDFTLGTAGNTNSSTKHYLAALFSSVTGMSKCGFWTGNGQSNGSNSITCGFNPRYVLIKRVDSTANWYVFDSLRNSGINYMELNTTTYSSGWDILGYNATGFTLKTSNADINASGGRYVYYAHA